MRVPRKPVSSLASSWLRRGEAGTLSILFPVAASELSSFPFTSTAIYGPDGSLLTEETAGDAQTILYEISKLVWTVSHADSIP